MWVSLREVARLFRKTVVDLGAREMPLSSEGTAKLSQVQGTPNRGWAWHEAGATLCSGGVTDSGRLLTPERG